jgi:hypothetical protein
MEGSRSRAFVTLDELCDVDLVIVLVEKRRVLDEMAALIERHSRISRR